MSSESHTEKFVSLHLPELWERSAKRVDFHFSSPTSTSYAAESGHAWRDLPPATQRAYIVVAIKKVERQLQNRASPIPPDASEAYSHLLDAMRELLWLTPHPRVRYKKKSTRRRSSSASHIVSPAKEVREIVSEADADVTPTILPMSAAWCNLGRVGGSSRLAAFSSQHSPKRTASSPLARIVAVAVAGEIDSLTENCGSLDLGPCGK
ncbi:hypothetical protein BDW22DRAFT_1357279 [Trametopsis cervina]|nr:hypothetical protein BDW22DRAFT_1357279 [Trametopsis cervina]